MSRALTEAERITLLYASESHTNHGRAYPWRGNVKDRLLASGYIEKIQYPGMRWPEYYITDAGRRAVAEYGSSGGRA